MSFILVPESVQRLMTERAQRIAGRIRAAGLSTEIAQALIEAWAEGAAWVENHTQPPPTL